MDVLHEIETDHFYRNQRKKWHFPQFTRPRVTRAGHRFALTKLRPQWATVHR